MWLGRTAHEIMSLGDRGSPRDARGIYALSFQGGSAAGSTTEKFKVTPSVFPLSWKSSGPSNVWWSRTTPAEKIRSAMPRRAGSADHHGFNGTQEAGVAGGRRQQTLPCFETIVTPASSTATARVGRKRDAKEGRLSRRPRLQRHARNWSGRRTEATDTAMFRDQQDRDRERCCHQTVPGSGNAEIFARKADARRRYIYACR